MLVQVYLLDFYTIIIPSEKNQSFITYLTDEFA